MKELPGIEQPSDVGEIVENGEHLPGHGEHDLVIGDNPNRPADVILRLAEGAIVAAIQLDSYDSPAHNGEHAPEKDIILNDKYYHEHISPQGDHLTKDQIRNVVENPDSVYRGVTRQGKPIYVWVKTIGGETHFVRAEDFDHRPEVPVHGIQVRSAYTEASENIENLIATYNLEQIWSE